MNSRNDNVNNKPDIEILPEDHALQKDLQHKIKLANALPISLLFVLLAVAGWMFEKQLETSYADSIAINLSPDNKESNEEESVVDKKDIDPKVLMASDNLYDEMIADGVELSDISISDILTAGEVEPLNSDELLLAKSITAKKLRRRKYYQKSLDLIISMNQKEQETYGLIFSKASALAKLGNKDAAIMSYKHLLSIENNHQAANINLGLLYLEQGQFVNAEQIFLKGTLNSAGNKKAKNFAGLGDAQYQQGKFQQASLSYRKSIEYRPTYALSWRNLAKVAKKMDDHSLVLDSYQKAIALEKSNLRIRLELADYMIARMNFVQAIAHLKIARKIDRESFAIRLKLAFAYMQARKPINARKQLNLAKKSIQREKEKRKSEAMQKYLSDKYPDAIELLKKNLKKNRNNNFEYYLIAKSFVALGRNKDAQKYLIKINPESLYYYQGKYLLAEAFVDNDRADESVQVYRQIVAEIQDNPRLLYQAAKAEQQAKNYQQAIDLIDSALKFRTNRRLLLRRADLNWQLGKKEQSITELSSIIDSYPNYLRAIYHLADYQRQLGRLDESVEQFSNLIEQRENYGDAQYQLATILFKQHKYAQAQELLGAFLLRKTDSRRSRLLYARTFCETGQFRQCKEQLNLVLKLAPGYQPALELQKSIIESGITRI